MFLNGCSTASIGRAIVTALPRLTVIAWETVVEDSAARAFLTGCLASLSGRAFERLTYERHMRVWWRRLLSSFGGGAVCLPKPIPDQGEEEGGAIECALRAFTAGCFAFNAANHRFGDPMEYIRLGHRRPPVQGSVVLIHADPVSGKLVEWRGSDLINESLDRTDFDSLLIERWRRRASSSAPEVQRA